MEPVPDMFVEDFDPPIDATNGLRVKHGLNALHPCVFAYGLGGVEIDNMGFDHITRDVVMIYFTIKTKVTKVVVFG